jgi:hypothetical protein
MRKLLSILVAAPVVFAASSAFAEDDSSHPGGYAVGVNHGIADLYGGSSELAAVLPFLGDTAPTGISVRYFVSPKFGLELIGSYSSNSFEPDAGGGTQSNSALNAAVLAEYRLSSTDKIGFSGYGGLQLSSGTSERDNDSGQTVSTDTSDLRFELGLKGEYFFARGFSVFGRTGVVIDPQNEDDRGTKGSGTAFSLFQNSDPLGSFGFSIWFK